MPLLDGLTEDAPILGVSPEELARRNALRPGSRGYNLGVGATNSPRVPLTGTAPPPDAPILGNPASVSQPPSPSSDAPILGNRTSGGILGNASPSPAPPPRPTAADYPAKQLTGWKKILGAAAVGAGAYESPTLGERINQELFQQPKVDAQNRLREAQSEYDVEANRPYEDARKTEQLAKAEQERAKAEALRNPQAKTDRTVAPESDLYYSLIDQGVPAEEAMRRAAEASKSKDPAQQRTAPQQAAFEDYLKQGMTPAQAYEKIRERPPEAPKPSKQLMLVPQPDGSSKAIEVTPGTVVPKGAETAPEFGKAGQPTADEQRRADLSRNMNENLDQLEEILNRRPDLFGWFSGRKTEAAGAIGTSDPDIAALKVIKEQMGMAMVGAHAMRNAQHVETAGNAIVNSYHNSPEAVKEAIKKARTSLQTFINDVQKGQGGGAQQNQAPPANLLKEGVHTTFKNGQTWTLQNGKPTQIP